VSRRWPLVALLACAVLLGVALAAYLLRSVKDVEAIGRKPSLVREFGEGAYVDQSFAVPRDGLHAVTLTVWSDRPAAVAFEFHLFRRGEGPSEEVASRVVDVSKPSGLMRERIEFPPITPAKDRVFVARLHLTRAAARDPEAAAQTRPVVALAAWADNPLPSGTLSLGGDDRWADLDFSAEASPSTRLGRMVDATNAALRWPIHLTPVTALFLTLVYWAVLVAVAGSAMAPLPASPSAPQPTSTTSSRNAPWQTRLRSACAIALVVAAPALFVSILAAREHVSADLLDQLDLAVMESPAGLHGAFSLWQEAINGFAPPALFAHPPSRVAWPVTIPRRDPLLRANVALRPYVWEHRSDGATFTISLEEGAAATTLASRFVNPGQNASDRAWVPVDVDLSQYAGRSVRLVFTTSPGPAGDAGWDWALWGNPRIVER
jgi:hypothetical protein